MRNIVLIIFFSAIASFSTAQSFTQEGIATYYSNKFVGRKTSNGEIYRHTKLTAAHASLPFGSEVLVTNLSNSKSVVVRINDRCSPRRIAIDLSKAAAAKLDLLHSGSRRVRIEMASDSMKQAYLAQEMALDSLAANDTSSTANAISPDGIQPSGFGIQVASVANIKAAKKLMASLESKYGVNAVYHKISRKRKHFYRVTIVGFDSRDSAAETLKRVKKKHHSAFITTIE